MQATILSSSEREGHRVRILWVGKVPTGGEAGDEVFDRKTIAELRRQGHTVTTVNPARVSRRREIANLLTGLPHYRARYASPENVRLVRQAASGHDLTICSWEPLDVFTPLLQQPAILIAHNVTSDALRQLFPGNLPVRLASVLAGRWEERIYRPDTLTAIAVLSRRDQALLRKLPSAPEVILTMPGMPPVIELASNASLRRELVLEGTYDWRPKRRDVLLFATDYARLPHRLPIFGNNLSDSVGTTLEVHPALDTAAHSQAIRFGLITDRFLAGHKLKTLAYIAQNQIVLSFADVVSDFVDLPDSSFFIRRLASVADIEAHVAEVDAVPLDDLRRRFQAFQNLCRNRFTWSSVAHNLLSLQTGRQRCLGTECQGAENSS